VLQQGVRSITDLMVMPGLINLDFADVRSVMGEMGKAMMGTGEGEGENRALEAAERAIANPLLDGVSMMGAKGVIISIIGGEDMKLLEIDEAANHIRELVDPEANIIWGSAFNPDLEGKIRVSVVATGIEQSAEMAERASQPLNLSAARGPKKPVLPLPTEEELAVDAAAAEEHATTHSPSESEDQWGDEDESGFGNQVAAPDETAPEEADAAPRMPEPYTPSMPETNAYAADAGGDDEEEYEEEEGEQGEDGSDSGGFASLMGTRINRETEGAAGEEDEGWQEDAGDYMGGYGAAEPAGGGGESSGEGADEDALELTMEAGESAEVEPQEPEGPQDELLLDADRLAEADQPVQPAGGRRRRMLGGGDEGADEPAAPAKPSAGSTLFERMANLSRAGTAPSEEEDEEGEGSSSLRIPRFLGRQNNQ
jgi:cell division protein FtsZ